ncbi:acyl--CoA ligase [Rhodococcus sp. F64268]|uniref:class I adenylate-forming enzyme family protein n=1 Tax=unclassified Rhodococcus (in: high G+C Gram-positive bacteria) TaxID=192944 RepID=UPI001F0DB727|nr:MULTISPECIES: class I adenylate-forming enzyme family protein [unclassified Rhodococcus (in: high G+C Gram-positive bacteria)]MCK0093838.1 acyl--CoA ligase [Rhodococcus sp. F64268]
MTWITSAGSAAAVVARDNDAGTPLGGLPGTFDSLWATAVRGHGAGTFLVFQDEDGTVTRWTYTEFDDVVARTAAGLRRRGIVAGDGIHLCLRNCPAFVALWLAAARVGAWIVPADPSASARDLDQQIGRTSPKLGLHSSTRRDAYLEGAAVHGLPTAELTETARDVLDSAVGLVDDEVATGEWTAPGPADRLALMFTSGTTSQPKGVVLTQANYFRVATAMAVAADLQAGDRWLVTLPLFHGNAQYYCFASAIAVGAGVGLTATFSASGWVRDAIALGATHASLFAAPMRMVLARTPADQPPAQLRHVWFAQSLGAEHHAEFGRLAGCLPRQLYGMTETVPIVTYDRSTPPVSDLIGTPLEGRVARLVTPGTLDPVVPGETGMIAVAGIRGDTLFEEYLDDPATTERTFRTDENGTVWMLTGDLAAETPHGWRFVGRADDVIKVAGENVSLTEVEATVAQAPGVLEAAVLARPDEIRDQVPVAYVVARDPQDPPSADELSAWAALNLTKAARPHEWTVVPELPRTSVGKIRRFKLADTEGAVTR